MSRVPFPETGTNRELVMARLRELKARDVNWRGGRASMFMFKANDEVSRLGQDAYVEYFNENALGSTSAFPSVRTMETEVVQMALDLFKAPEGARGFMTTGGTESIIQAVQSCRNWSRAARGQPTHRGNIVAFETVHPAFDKAANLMDLEVRRLPVDPWTAPSVASLESAIDTDTILLVGSAPNYPYGSIDPIAELGELAQRRKLWLHVDACVGGYLAPFARQIGRALPTFDFSIAGVSSMSADLHKYGFCPKPASTVLYRTADQAKQQVFDADVWPSGRFVTTTLVGTRPAGGVAAAWAMINFLGAEGYRAIASELMTSIDAYIDGIHSIDGLRVVGKPDLAVVAFTSDQVDMMRVAGKMSGKGWLPGLIRKPTGIHRMMSMLHAASNEQFLADLREAVGSQAGR
jgi:sphinganine-1-phosphate aldolase